METPTLNKKQQKMSLSAKKTKVKETIKNVVASAYNNNYWPVISPEDHHILKEILENNLPNLKIQRVNIPWSKLKGLSKQERKKFKEDHLKNMSLPDEEQINSDRDGLCFGINDTTKLLEKNSASAVLISSDVQPRIMVQHVIDLSVLYAVPVIIFNDLRSVIKSVCGISGAVISISKNIKSETGLMLIRESVKRIFEKSPTPVDHINYNRSLQPLINIQNKEDIDKSVDIVKDIVDVDEMKREVYLKRDSISKRVFIPESIETKSDMRMEVDAMGFLAFSEEPANTVPAQNSIVKPKYKSLIVKRLKGDPNRNRRKVSAIKRKKDSRYFTRVGK